MSKKEEKECLSKVIDVISKNKESSLIFANVNIESFLAILSSAKSNEEHSKFPDFLFDNGCIEHFSVSSSKEDKKGSSFRKELALKSKEQEKHLKEEFAELPFEKNTFSIISSTNVYTNFSYEWFLESFKRNYSSHIRSLNKVKQEYKEVVFLIEHKAPRMIVQKHSKSPWYQLNKDKRILEYLKENRGNVRYVIYFIVNAVEIIDLAKIDSLIIDSCYYEKVECRRYCVLKMLNGSDL